MEQHMGDDEPRNKATFKIARGSKRRNLTLVHQEASN